MRYLLLGLLEVRDGDGAVVSVPSGKQKTVLHALLLHPGQVLPAETLIDVLWGGGAPATARAGLSTYVARLRDALGPAVAPRLVHEGGGYQLRLGDEDVVDHLQAARLESRARPAAAARRWDAVDQAATAALELWRGEPLADLDHDKLRAEFQPYFTELRLRLEQLRIDAHLATGRFETIVPTLRRLSGVHPLHEPFHEREFVALYGAGRRTEAQAGFQRVRALLREELGVDPSPSLRRFHELSLRNAPVGELVDLLVAPGRVDARLDMGAGRPSGDTREPPRPAPTANAVLAHQLPPPPRRFIGRAGDLARITAAMAGNHPPQLPGLTLLVGMAGVGKTALALTWAQQAAADFPDGRLYLDMLGFAGRGGPIGTDQAVRTLLDCLGVPDDALPASPEGRVALYRAEIADKRLLVVLDNVRDPEQVRPLLPQSGPAQVLATSRSTLASLVTIDFARTVALEPFSPRESVELLNLRLGPERTEGHEAAVAAIAASCAHLPLALVVAAGRAWTRPDIALDDLAAELRAIGSHGLGALDGGDPTINVRAVMSWSYLQLSPQAARMFRLLALHPGPDVSIAAAAALTGAAPAAAHAALVELESMNMATMEQAGRYRRHNLLEVFAAEQLAAEETEAGRQAAYRRLVDSYLHTLVNAHSLRGTHPVPDRTDLAKRLGRSA